MRKNKLHGRSLIFAVAILIGAVACSANASAAGKSEIERGRYLATVGDCISCHTRPGGEEFAGGRAFTTPFGTIYSTNITPDGETGIGKWKVDDLGRAMHEGIDPAGRRLFPAFPYPSFTSISDRDVGDLYAYFQSVKPVRAKPPENSFLLRLRWPMVFWNALFFQPARFVADPSRTAQWNRGAYLVEGLGHCGACHSPRNVLMAEIKVRAYTGGTIMDEIEKDEFRRWSAVDLTPSKQGLAAWSIDQLVKYLKSGFSSRAGTFGPMNDVIRNSLSKMTTEDLRAMALYIHTLPTHGNIAPTAAATQDEAGETIYKNRCEKCHLASGRGGLFNGPPLANSAIVQNDDPASLINIMLYGPQTPKEISLGAWETMQPYRGILDDAQIAAVANYVRGSWGNRGRVVEAAEVARQR